MRGDRQAWSWLGSAALHLAAAGLLAGVMRAAPPEAGAPPMLVELPEPAPEAEAMPEEPAPTETPAEAEQTEAEASPEPPPAEIPPPVAELPDPPPPTPLEVAEAPPEPALEESAEALPLPPPAMPPPRPMRVAAAAPRPTAQPAPAAASPAPAEQAAAPGAPPRAVAAPSSSYIAQLLAALERQKRYPEEARARQVQGVALLRFRMRRDGSVAAFRIERSAGDAALDEAVLAMVRRASPLPAPPPEMPGETLELTVPVRFALR